MTTAEKIVRLNGLQLKRLFEEAGIKYSHEADLYLAIGDILKNKLDSESLDLLLREGENIESLIQQKIYTVDSFR